MTPPSTFEVKKNGKWQIRVIPNAFPITNTHEVVIEMPKHDQDIAAQSTKKIEEILDAYSKRYVALSKKKGIKYVQIFRNRGAAGGASLQHPHTQILGMPMMPKLVQEEMDAFKKKCSLCGIAAKEKQRMIAKNKSFVAFAPYASKFAYETWIVPLRHAARISDLDKNQLRDLAGVLKKILMKLDAVLKKPAYNLIIHQSPLHGYNYYHMHLELMPVTTTLAGFEKSTDYFVNLTMPEEAAKQLRKA
jgi:UDPglucose--hexose-1-phosphate uridylyltransferase